MSFRNIVLLKSCILKIPTVDCASSKHVDVVTCVLYSINVSLLRIRAYCFQPRRLPVIEARLFPRLIRYCAVDGCLSALLWRLYEVREDVVKQPLCAREKGVVDMARCLGSHESRVHCISGHSQAWQQKHLRDWQQQQQQLLTSYHNKNKNNSYWLPILTRKKKKK